MRKNQPPEALSSSYARLRGDVMNQSHLRSPRPLSIHEPLAGESDTIHAVFRVVQSPHRSGRALLYHEGASAFEVVHCKWLTLNVGGSNSMVESQPSKFRSDSSRESQMVFVHAIKLRDRAGVA